jgi:folate-binding Fe-S cluster repair protein YgfZ
MTPASPSSKPPVSSDWAATPAPPRRRLVRLHLDGSPERFLNPGVPLTAAGSSVTVGRLGSVSYHYELGPVGLGVVNAAVDDGVTLLADGVPAQVEWPVRQ